jgi:hypothetical protein
MTEHASDICFANALPILPKATHLDEHGSKGGWVLGR